MMRTVMFLGLFLLLLAFPVHAEQNGYRLRVPSVEEYLAAVPGIIAQADDNYLDVRRVIAHEFHMRYGDILLSDISFDLLSEFHRVIAIGFDTGLSWLPIDVYRWFPALLEAGFRDRDVHEISDEITIGSLKITPTPVDLSGDGTDEHLLEVYDEVSGRTFYILVVRSDDDIMLLPVPLPYIGLLSSLGTREMPETGNLITQRLGDINNDGSTEWIVLGQGYGYWQWCGKLYVIDWQDGALVDLTGDLFSFCIPQAQFDTAANEYHYTQQVLPWGEIFKIQMVETRIDGWRCEREKVDSLIWNGAASTAVTVWSGPASAVSTDMASTQSMNALDGTWYSSPVLMSNIGTLTAFQ
jgi:hypothetical protein